jgi:hypothetical protein
MAMYSNLPAPFVTVLVDHPSCALELFAMPDMFITCYDRSHVAFLKKYLGPARKIGFLPHGGSVAGHGATLEKRSIDVLFPGTFTDVDEAYTRFRAACSEEIFEILDCVVERLIQADCEPMEDALTTVLHAEGREEWWRKLSEYLPLMESFVKPYKRMEVLTHLDRAGIAVEIVGSSWPPDRFKHHKLRPAVPYPEVLKMMRQSKIVLNMGFVPDGSHERAFSAMLNGAVPACDFNRYLAERFTDGNEILLFRWTQLRELPPMLMRTLGDDARRQEQSARAAAAASRDTWAARAPLLLDFVRNAAHAGPDSGTSP